MSRKLAQNYEEAVDKRKKYRIERKLYLFHLYNSSSISATFILVFLMKKHQLIGRHDRY